jgi:hypothetical protein
MNEYSPYGPKKGEFKDYQKIKFLQRNIGSIDVKYVDEYSLTLGKLLRWL